MPRQLMCTAPRKLEWVEYEDQPIQPGQVRYRVECAAAKHGTELSTYKGVTHERGAWDSDQKIFIKTGNEAPRPFNPSRMGNMATGVVTEVGAGVGDYKPGDKVFGYGGFAETITREAPPAGKPFASPEWKWVWKLPAGVNWKSAMLLDPADFALCAVRDGNVRVGDAVAIFGLGAIGLVAVQIAKAAGAFPIFAVDLLPNRLEAAKACGADYALSPSEGDVGVEIRKITGGRGVDVAIEYSGAWQGLQGALRAVAFGGNVVAGAYPPPYPAGLDLGAEAHMNRPNLIFTRACSDPSRDHPRWDNPRIYETCWQLIEKGIIDGEPIVDPVVPFDSLIEEYPKIETAPGENIKLGARVG